jgi:hypothetical protein
MTPQKAAFRVTGSQEIKFRDSTLSARDRISVLFYYGRIYFFVSRK